MNMRFAVPCVIACVLGAPTFMSEVFAQAGTPGTKQMRDVQRKAEQKARRNQPRRNTAQHQAASAVAPASSP
ncbi:hypothetical protein [Paraburkholderia lycopersici]|uniref:Uncharacterized protein n=1 Tax=Paraburkholderia lycopersici TaxID=416944 RepID=A0A1G6HG52_9BURK|nr:hypothetical protein [Paraburkholderia lycopersici]SDB93220.1 hypothetical protein SAMN05421548_102283 [Paraburkholderia lycopersici]